MVPVRGTAGKIWLSLMGEVGGISGTCEGDCWQDLAVPNGGGGEGSVVPVRGTAGRIWLSLWGRWGGISGTCEGDCWQDLADAVPDGADLQDGCLHVGPLAHEDQEHDGSLKQQLFLV